MTPFHIHPDIEQAHTLPARVYRDPEIYRSLCESVFARSWQVTPDVAETLRDHTVVPVTLLPGCLDEPILFSRDPEAADGAAGCFANVCTHRGNLLCAEPHSPRELRCRYHGRRFALNGTFRSMPEFEQTADFPTAADNLAPVPTASLGPLRFAGVSPDMEFASWIGPIRDRTAFLDWNSLRLDPDGSRVYPVAANWALYCDNYLEGFHIPFVHPGLNQALDYTAYRTELAPHGTLQIGIADPGEDSFDLPRGHPDHGHQVAAYYAWLYPNTMINVYPWGVSVNVIQPKGPHHTEVLYRTYVLDESRRGRGAGADLHTVELEDQSVVEAVQRGIRSRLYDRGRYSPTREQGVHHFHRMLARALHPTTD